MGNKINKGCNDHTREEILQMLNERLATMMSDKISKTVITEDDFHFLREKEDVLDYTDRLLLSLESKKINDLYTPWNRP